MNKFLILMLLMEFNEMVFGDRINNDNHDDENLFLLSNKIEYLSTKDNTEINDDNMISSQSTVSNESRKFNKRFHMDKGKVKVQIELFGLGSPMNEKTDESKSIEIENKSIETNDKPKDQILI